MSEPLKPTAVFYFFGLLYRNDLLSVKDIKSYLKDKDSLTGCSLENDFDFNLEEASLKNYYQKEMGQMESLSRAYIFSTSPLERELLISLKLKTNQLEVELQNNFEMTGRVVNVDPGYLALEQVVLATCKPYGHRVYLGEGVFSELTYQFQGRDYHSLPWTYPDYCNLKVRDHFKKVRSVLKDTLKSN